MLDTRKICPIIYKQLTFWLIQVALIGTAAQLARKNMNIYREILAWA